MGHNKSISRRTGYGVLLGVGLTVAVLLGLYFGGLLSIGNVPVAGFSVDAKDGPTGTAIPDGNVTWSLYGVTAAQQDVFGTTTPTFSGMTLINSSIRDLALLPAVLSVAKASNYVAYYVQATADNVAQPWMTYSETQVQLVADGANHLAFYAVPKLGSWINGYEDPSLGVVPLTANISVGAVTAPLFTASNFGNLTVNIIMNATQVGRAGYVSYTNYTEGKVVKLYFVFTTNATVATPTTFLTPASSSAWSLIETIPSGITGTVFSCTTLSLQDSSFVAKWGASASTATMVTSANLYYGSINDIASGWCTAIATAMS